LSGDFVGLAVSDVKRINMDGQDEQDKEEMMNDE